MADVARRALPLADSAPRPSSTGSCRSHFLHALAGHKSGVLSLAFSKNGSYMMSASQDKSLKLWNPLNSRLIKTYAGPHNLEVNGVTIFQDNSKFVSCGGDKPFFLWDVTSGQVIRKFVGHDQKVNAVTLGPNEEVVISASHDKTVRAWDLRAKSRSAIQSLNDATDSVLCVMAVGDEIVTGCVDGALRRYDIRRGQLVVDHLVAPVGSVSFSGDQQCILVSTLDSRIHLLERDTGNVLANYRGHVNTRFKVQSLLDPTDAHVLSGSEDGRLCFWDLVEAELLEVFEAHSAPVFCTAMQEQLLVTAAADGSIKVWKTILS